MHLLDKEEKKKKFYEIRPGQTKEAAKKEHFHKETVKREYESLFPGAKIAKVALGNEDLEILVKSLEEKDALIGNINDTLAEVDANAKADIQELKDLLEFKDDQIKESAESMEAVNIALKETIQDIELRDAKINEYRVIFEGLKKEQEIEVSSLKTEIN